MDRPLNETIFDHLLIVALTENLKQTSAALPAEDELEDTFSEAFERKMRRSLKAQERPRRLRQVLTITRRLAVAALVIVAVGFAGLMSSAEIRADVYNTIIEFGEKYLGFSFSPISEAPTGEIIEPHLPEGFYETDRFAHPNSTTVDYANEQGIDLCFIAIDKAKGSTLQIDNEHSVAYTVAYHGTVITVMDGTSFHDASYVYWENEAYFYMVYGYYDPEALTDMAKSCMK